MRQKILAQKIKKATFGMCSVLLDILLLEAKIFARVAGGERVSASNLFRVIDEELGVVPRRSCVRAFAAARQRGFISKYGVLTKKGAVRIEKTFKVYRPPFRWNGTWMFVIFDIPEKQRAKRSVLRSYLRKWKFGKLQNSVWVSVHDSTKELLDLCALYGIEPPQVLFWKTKNIGMNPAKAAQHIWDLHELNNRYESYIEEYGSSHLSFGGVFAFLAIAQDDPQLPQELLPDSWKGEKAFRLYQKFTSKNR